MKPVISVCIPVYNVESHIEGCLKSVQMQDFKDIEIVVVDDCSPDNSMEIVRDIAASEPRIRIIRNERNMGLNWTRKVGYEAAEGDYIFFLDSDDTVPPDALNVLYREALKSGADIVAGQVSFSFGGKTDHVLFSNYLEYGVSLLENLVKGNIKHNLCGKLYKRELLQDYSYITYEQLTNSEDALLFYQMSENVSKITIIGDVVYNYIYNSQSSSSGILPDKAVRNIMIAGKQIYNIIERHPDLMRMYLRKYVRELSLLATQIKPGTGINVLLSKYCIPVRMNLKTILRYTVGIDAVLCMIRYYFPWAVRIYRLLRYR